VSNQHTGENEGDVVRKTVYSLQELTAFETRTLATEINLLGLLRGGISPVARYGDKIQIRIPQAPVPACEAGEATCLSQGFPLLPSKASLSVSEGLFAATNQVWNRLTPSMERSEKSSQEPARSRAHSLS
jgi:hypothetical protein